MIEQASLVIGNGNWAVKSDSLLGYKINGGKYYPREMSVVRATTGTRINEDGLVELVPYNLFTYSEQFDNAAWIKIRASITANAATSPDGYTNADAIIADTVLDDHYVGQGIAVTNATSYAFSAFLKKGNKNWARLWNTSVGYVDFDLTNGVVGTQSSATGIIESFGDGWYRCTILYTASSTSVNPHRIYTLEANNNKTFAGDASTVNLYIWGAQLVEGTEPLDYLPTTDRLDIARIDYSTGEPALLLEPQRTNLAFPSSNSSTNFSLVNTSFLASQINGLSGTLSGALISETVATGIHYYGLTNGISVTLGTAYTFSIYLKKGNGGTAPDIIQLTFNSGGFGSVYANFNISTGIVTLQSGVVATISEGVNGYYRCSITATATSTNASTGAVIGFANNNPTSSRLPSYVGLTTSNFFYDGFQLEAGSYATSYIPTTAAVTRNADVISKTGIADLIGQTEGTMFVECSALADDATNRRITISDGTANNRIYISYKNYTNQLRIDVISAGSSVFDSTYTIADITQTAKIAVAYKLNDFAFYVNGVQAAVDTSGAVPTSMSVFKFEDGAGGNVFFGKVNQAILFPTRLTNAELATLTTI
jgi:hypothetical protein